MRRFFRERYDDDDGPISEFAATQRTVFYDHDFLEHHFSGQPTGDVSRLLGQLSYSDQYLDGARRSYERAGPGAVNTAVMLSRSDIESPRSCRSSDYWLHHLGRFTVEPRATRDEALTLVPRVRLRLKKGGPIQIGGATSKEVVIDRAGLAIGCGDWVGDTPYLDLSRTPGCEGLAPLQVTVHRNPAEIWIVQDHGANGLTRIDGTVLNGERSAPWRGVKIELGALVLVWELVKG